MTFNLFAADDNVTVSGSTDSVSIDPSCTTIRLYPVSGDATIYINSTGNSPGIKLYEPVSLENVEGQITDIYVYSAGDATVNIKQVKTPGGVVVK